MLGCNNKNYKFKVIALKKLIMVKAITINMIVGSGGDHNNSDNREMELDFLFVCFSHV